jgi:hypothetical protein
VVSCAWLGSSYIFSCASMSVDNGIQGKSVRLVLVVPSQVRVISPARFGSEQERVFRLTIIDLSEQGFSCFKDRARAVILTNLTKSLPL